MNATPAHTAEGHALLESARLSGLLRHARRRLGLARLLQTLSLGVPSATAVLIAFSWLVGRVEPLMAAAGLAATVAAGLVAWFGAPHAADLAALLDERLRLADRISTALQVGARTDAVALLIQHDAVAHVSPAGIESAFPLRIHRGTWLACAAVAASAGLWLVDRPRLGNEAPNSGTGGGITVRTSPGAGAAARGPTATSRQNDRASRPTSPAAGPPSQATATARTEGSEGSRDRAPQAGTPKSMAPEDRAATGRGAGTGDSTSRASRGNGASGSQGRGTTAAGGARDVREAAARGATDAAATTGGGAAGGVQYGRRLDRGATVATELAGPPPTAAAIRQGQLRAETAIAHEEVPPRYRAYLRDYFRAVQSTGEP